ncbi:MAG: T9SS type A sorting domain-containing protein [Paludibacter sp.]|nr:T9SS type A sorting domain-containing protein [Paludibacter sp.]
MKKRLFLFVFGFYFIANIYSQTSIGAENLTHQWNFDDGSAKDVIGNADGTLIGNAYIQNGALKTKGGYLNLPAQLIEISKYSNISFEIWFKSDFNANTNFTMLFYFGDKTLYEGTIPDRINTYVGSNGLFVAAARKDKISRAAISCDPGSESNPVDYFEPWSYESSINSVQYDDSVLHQMISTISNSEISFYIDGSLIGKTALADSNKLFNISDNFAYLAKSGYELYDSNWEGTIYKFSIYNKELNSDEVLGLYNDGGENNPGIFISSDTLEFDEFNKINSFSVDAFNLSDSIRIITPVGMVASPNIIGKNSLSQYINIEYDGVSDSNGYVVLSSGTQSDTVYVSILKNSECLNPLYNDKINLINDPYMHSLNGFVGWINAGSKEIISDSKKSFCGLNCAHISSETESSASIDQDLTGIIKPLTNYRVKAMVNAVDGAFQLGINGWDNTKQDTTVLIPQSNGWAQIEFSFKTGSVLGDVQVLYFNNWMTGGREAYIDNWEAYEMSPDLTSTGDIKSEFEIYCNPDGIVVANNSNVTGNIKITVYTLQGIPVVQQNGRDNSMSKEIILKNRLVKGVYFVCIEFNEKSYFKKILI